MSSLVESFLFSRTILTIILFRQIHEKRKITVSPEIWYIKTTCRSNLLDRSKRAYTDVCVSTHDILTLTDRETRRVFRQFFSSRRIRKT